MTIGLVLIVYSALNLMFFVQEGNTEFLIARGEEHASETLKWIERWSVWITIMLFIVAFGYVFSLVDIIRNAPPGTAPYITW
ncbi:hypothetical protein [Sporosarcina ureae]|uniref:Uncharacterized protein n=1 Tax=Sporosarcina ureae TaxID=1571 RepID=A0ABN4Z032_SPOUR|nr:hypothetical protein [Sporosarcina ureae]ARF14698.1 hypothetical protein SporoS204_11410 [Sporosarcina ureae]